MMKCLPTACATPIAIIRSVAVVFSLHYGNEVYISLGSVRYRAATADKAGKVWSLPRFWVSIHSYKKQPVKKFGVEYWTVPCLAQIRHGGPASIQNTQQFSKVNI